MPFVLLLGGLAGCGETTVSVVEVASVEVSPPTLVLIEGEREQASVVLRETGGGVLTGRAVSWSVDDSAVASVDMDGEVEGLRAGETLVRAVSEGVEGSADITILPAPSISLSVDSVVLEGVSGDAAVLRAEVELLNGGAGTLGALALEIQATGGLPPTWLEATLGAEAAPTTIRLRANAAALHPGDHRALVVVASPAAVDGPRELPVRFRVRERPPEIAVSSSSVSLSAVQHAQAPAEVTLQVLNAGGGILGSIQASVRYPEGAPSGWLVARVDGSSAPAQLHLSASARHLPPGSHHATVDVSSPVATNHTTQVDVRFTVAPASGQGGSSP